MMRERRHWNELLLAFIAMLFIGAAYYLVMRSDQLIPPAGDFFGLSIGIIGFILMLMTETLYSLRKRSRLARWGPLSEWLSLHVFTGLVGPFMVLLHTSWKFDGLAGIATWMMVLVVFSGILGRYLYSLVPHSREGLELQAADLEQQIQQIQEEMDALGPQNRQLKILQLRQNLLRRQIQRLPLTRRLLSAWHFLHVPISLALFVAAFVHIWAALYYGILMR